MHQVLFTKKLIAVTTIFILLININKETLQKMKNLDQVSYVYYLILFRKNIKKAEIMELINFKSKINAKNPAYTAKLGF